MRLDESRIAAPQLLAAAIEGGTSDNVSFILVDVRVELAK